MNCYSSTQFPTGGLDGWQTCLVCPSRLRAESGVPVVEANTRSSRSYFLFFSNLSCLISHCSILCRRSARRRGSTRGRVLLLFSVFSGPKYQPPPLRL